jgi:hypothetical protein
VVTFGINAAFMQMGLAYTALEGTGSTDGNAEKKEPTESNPNSNLGISDEPKVSVSHFEGEVTPAVPLVS